MAQQAERVAGSEWVWTIRPRDLQVADLILTGSHHVSSVLIRKVTGSRFSHVALHVGGGFIVEATTRDGVRRIHVRRIVANDPAHLMVLRPLATSEEQRQHASLAARALLYRPYAWRGAVAALQMLARLRASSQAGRFCSQLVAEAYRDAGLLGFGALSPTEVKPGDFLADGIREGFTEVTRSVLHRLKAKSLTAAQQALRPTLRATTPSQRMPSLPAQSLEVRLLRRARRLMSRSAFREPYHFFDVLRQLVERAATHSREVAAIDAALHAEMAAAGIMAGAVQPRSTVPGLVDDVMSFNLAPFVDAGEDMDDALEFVRLGEDLRAGRDWDMQDKKQAMDEMEHAAGTTGLRSLGTTFWWFLADYSISQANYQQLDMIPRPEELGDFAIAFR